MWKDFLLITKKSEDDMRKFEWLVFITKNHTDTHKYFFGYTFALKVCTKYAGSNIVRNHKHQNIIENLIIR